MVNLLIKIGQTAEDAFLEATANTQRAIAEKPKVGYRGPQHNSMERERRREIYWMSGEDEEVYSP